MLALALAVYYQHTIVYQPPGRPISAEMVDELLDSFSVDVVALPPSLLEELSQSQSSLERLKKVKYVLFAGGKSLTNIPRTWPI